MSYIAEPKNEKVYSSGEDKAGEKSRRTRTSHFQRSRKTPKRPEHFVKFRRLPNTFSQIHQTRTESQISQTLVTRKSNHFNITAKSSEEWYCGSSFTKGRSVSKQPITSQDIGKQTCHQPKGT